MAGKNPANANPTLDSWLGWKGDVSHATAPAGAGGPGKFRSARGLGVASDLVADLPHPAAPVSRKLALDTGTIAKVASTKAKAAPAKKNPPPATTTSTAQVKLQKDAVVDIDVKVEVVADSTSSDPTMTGADTKADTTSSLTFATPQYEYKTKGGKNIISALTSLATFKGTITIQTTYAPTASADIISGYGRGTTPEDEAAGNVTLGFHESCHREDFLTFLKKNPLPDYQGKVGQTEAEFKAAGTKWAADVKAYFARMGADTVAKTDEVGYKRSEYKANGPRP